MKIRNVLMIGLISLTGIFSVQAVATNADIEKGKLLFLEREDDAKAKAAEDLFRSVWSVTADAALKFESGEWLTRTLYFRGKAATTNDEKKALHLEGYEVAQTLIKLDKTRPEGWWFFGINAGQWGTANGKLKPASLKLRGKLLKSMEMVKKIDESYDYYGADRALGRYYYALPKLFGGDKEGKSQDHLSYAHKNAPESSLNVLYYAELLVAIGKRKEARDIIETFLKVDVTTFAHPKDPKLDRVPESKIDTQMLKDLLKTL